MLDQKVKEESKVFINRVKEARHFKTLDWHKAKFEQLCKKNKGVTKDGCLNNQYMYDNGKNLDSRITATTTTAPAATSKWVINMYSIPLTEVPKQLLAHGANFTISPKIPPIGEYIAAVE